MQHIYIASRIFPQLGFALGVLSSSVERVRANDDHALLGAGGPRARRFRVAKTIVQNKKNALKSAIFMRVVLVKNIVDPPHKKSS